jgi:hypothetical protein
MVHRRLSPSRQSSANGGGYARAAGASGNAATPARGDGAAATNSDGAAAATTPAPRTRPCGGRDRWRHGRRHYRRCAGPRTGRARRRSSWCHDRSGCRCGSASAAWRILLVARRLLLSLSERCLVAANGSALLRLLSWIGLADGANLAASGSYSHRIGQGSGNPPYVKGGRMLTT